MTAWVTLPKPKKKVKTKKRLGLRKTPLSKLKRLADKLAGELCRARGNCEACGVKNNTLQWSHIISRNYHNIRWIPQNCLCLCKSCHYKFTVRPDEWIAFLMKHYSTTYLWLYKEKEKYVKINRSFLETTIKELKEVSL